MESSSATFSIDSERSTDTPSEDDDPDDGYQSRSSIASTVSSLSCLQLLVKRPQKKSLLESCICFYCLIFYAVGNILRSRFRSERDESFDFDSLPSEVKGRILEFLDHEQISQLPAVSKGWKALIQSPEFRQALSLKDPSTLTACYFFIDKGIWQWAGFDPIRLRWRRMPPLTFLPTDCTPDEDLFKQFLICANKGLVAMNFSKSPHEERIIVFNPLTQQSRELPPLLHRRNPVLMHMIVDEATRSYQILVAGSSSSSDEKLSKITELYSSRTKRWEEVDALPGPAFALNEYQSGIFKNGTIFCIGFQERGDQIVKGIWGFRLADRKWIAGNVIPSCAILQLVENNGEMYLFSERENGRATEHCVDRILDADFESVNVIKKIKSGGRSLEVYPESALVPFNHRQLCLYNTVDHTGHVFAVQALEERDSVDHTDHVFVQDHEELDAADHTGRVFNGQVHEEREALPALPEKGFRGELSFFCLNPMSFAIELRFNAKV